MRTSHHCEYHPAPFVCACEHMDVQSFRHVQGKESFMTRSHGEIHTPLTQHDSRGTCIVDLWVICSTDLSLCLKILMNMFILPCQDGIAYSNIVAYQTHSSITVRSSRYPVRALSSPALDRLDMRILNV